MPDVSSSDSEASPETTTAFKSIFFLVKGEMFATKLLNFNNNVYN